MLSKFETCTNTSKPVRGPSNLVESQRVVTNRCAGVFCQGGQNLKKGHFFVEKALPTKANFDSHAAI